MWWRIDGSDGTTEPLTEVALRVKLDGYYKDLAQALATARRTGQPLTTGYANYEWREAPSP